MWKSLEVHISCSLHQRFSECWKSATTMHFWRTKRTTNTPKRKRKKRLKVFVTQGEADRGVNSFTSPELCLKLGWTPLIWRSTHVVIWIILVTAPIVSIETDAPQTSWTIKTDGLWKDRGSHVYPFIWEQPFRSTSNKASRGWNLWVMPPLQTIASACALIILAGSRNKKCVCFTSSEELTVVTH